MKKTSLILFLTAVSFRGMCQDCDKVLETYTTIHYKDKSSYVSSLKKLNTNNNQDAKAKSNSLDISLILPVDGIPVPFGLNQQNSSDENSIRNSLNQIETHNHIKLDQNIDVKYLPERAYQSYDSCMNSNPGIKVRYKFNRHGNIITGQIDFLPPGTTPWPIIDAYFIENNGIPQTDKKDWDKTTLSTSHVCNFKHR